MKLRKCLNCGASLKSNKKLGIRFCEYCGEEYPINVESGDVADKEWKKKIQLFD